MAKIPETVYLRTMDNELVEMSGKVANEFEPLRNAFSFDTSGNAEVEELPVACNAAPIRNAIKVFSFYNLDEPYVKPENFKTRQEIRNADALAFLGELPHDDMFAIVTMSDVLNSDRLIDCCMLFFLELTQGKDTKTLRQLFKFKEDYTPEQEEEIRARHVIQPNEAQ